MLSGTFVANMLLFSRTLKTLSVSLALKNIKDKKGLLIRTSKLPTLLSDVRWNDFFHELKRFILITVVTFIDAYKKVIQTFHFG